MSGGPGRGQPPAAAGGVAAEQHGSGGRVRRGGAGAGGGEARGQPGPGTQPRHLAHQTGPSLRPAQTLMASVSNSI